MSGSFHHISQAGWDRCSLLYSIVLVVASSGGSRSSLGRWNGGIPSGFSCCLGMSWQHLGVGRRRERAYVGTPCRAWSLEECDTLSQVCSVSVCAMRCATLAVSMFIWCLYAAFVVFSDGVASQPTFHNLELVFD